MSKGHLEALQALKAMRAKKAAEPVTKLAAVTKSSGKSKVKVGRPKIHASAADRQRACRARKRATA